MCILEMPSTNHSKDHTEESSDLWKDWWKAFQECTLDKARLYHNNLKELYTTGPNLPPEPHPILSRYARGFHRLGTQCMVYCRGGKRCNQSGGVYHKKSSSQIDWLR